MSRKNARETLYKLVFEYLFSRETNERTEGLLLLDASLTEDDRDYVRSTYQGIADRYDELTSVIAGYITGYSSVDRLVKADLASLLISTYELMCSPDIPASVSINEAIELVKQFSTSKSCGFVNGVLASINREVRKNG